jgi:hypothetical protein
MFSMSRKLKRICFVAIVTLTPVLSACDNRPIVGPDFGDRVGGWLDQGWW